MVVISLTSRGVVLIGETGGEEDVCIYNCTVFCAYMMLHVTGH